MNTDELHSLEQRVFAFRMEDEASALLDARAQMRRMGEKLDLTNPDSLEWKEIRTIRRGVQDDIGRILQRACGVLDTASDVLRNLCMQIAEQLIQENSVLSCQKQEFFPGQDRPVSTHPHDVLQVSCRKTAEDGGSMRWLLRNANLASRSLKICGGAMTEELTDAQAFVAQLRRQRPEIVHRVEKYYSEKDYKIYTWKTDKGIVSGCAVVKPNKESAYIEQLLTLPDAQGEGVGTADRKDYKIYTWKTDKGIVSGCAVVKPNKESAYIEQLLTLPDAQGEGVGTALLKGLQNMYEDLRLAAVDFGDERKGSKAERQGRLKSLYQANGFCGSETWSKESLCSDDIQRLTDWFDLGDPWSAPTVRSISIDHRSTTVQEFFRTC